MYRGTGRKYCVTMTSNCLSGLDVAYRQVRKSINMDIFNRDIWLRSYIFIIMYISLWERSTNAHLMKKCVYSRTLQIITCKMQLKFYILLSRKNEFIKNNSLYMLTPCRGRNQNLSNVMKLIFLCRICDFKCYSLQNTGYFFNHQRQSK